MKKRHEIIKLMMIKRHSAMLAYRSILIPRGGIYLDLEKSDLPLACQKLYSINVSFLA